MCIHLSVTLAVTDADRTAHPVKAQQLHMALMVRELCHVPAIADAHGCPVTAPCLLSDLRYPEGGLPAPAVANLITVGV